MLPDLTGTCGDDVGSGPMAVLDWLAVSWERAAFRILRGSLRPAMTPQTASPRAEVGR